MNTKSLIALAAVALASTATFAHEADLSGQYAASVNSTRTRAEVKAEAVDAVAHYNIEPASSRVISFKSTGDVKVVRAQAVQALRQGQISRGEV